MNPLDHIVKFINDSRANGIPDKLIYEGLQAALLEAAMLEAVASQQRKPKASRPAIGFYNSNSSN